jgi:S-adenosylmethionine-diacylglycerol 3-amino-3-carboxypropyl transferase
MANIISYLIKSNYIYPLSWEDPRVDEEILQINNNDIILGITTGGDNILNYLINSPKKIITCDINSHQNYLLEMKLSAMQNLDQNDFYEMFFNKNKNIWLFNKSQLINNLRTEDSMLFWTMYGDEIFKSFIYSGTCKYGKYIVMCFPKRLRDIVNHSFDSIETQRKAYEKIRPYVCIIFFILDFLLFKLNFISILGVPIEQQDTNKETKCIDFTDFIFNNTLFNENYFYKAFINEKLEKNNIPEYCKSSNYEHVKKQLYKIKIYNCTIENCMKYLDDNIITKVSLLDHMDWMNDEEISKEMYQLERVVHPNHKIIYRSFSKTIPKKSLYKITNWSDNIHKSSLINKDRIGTYLSLHTIHFEKEIFFNPGIDKTFCRSSSIYDDLKIIYNMYFRQMNKSLKSHQERLDSFYENQADYYDTYRQHMLHGRESMIASIPFKHNSNWLDIGGGTGYSVNLINQSLFKFKKIDIIEYSKSMFKVLNNNIANYPNIQTYCIDIHDFESNIKYDIITFSYSIVMIPDNEKTIKKALSLLKTDGIIAITDFYADDNISGYFWKSIFKNDGVYLTNNINKILEKNNCSKLIFKIDKGGFPYIPLLKCKYFTAIYKKS